MKLDRNECCLGKYVLKGILDQLVVPSSIKLLLDFFTKMKCDILEMSMHIIYKWSEITALYFYLRILILNSFNNGLYRVLLLTCFIADDQVY